MYIDDGFAVNHDDLAGYRQVATGLADEVRAVATSTLGDVSDLPAETFGRIGVEVGLGQAFRTTVQAQLAGINIAADAISEMATSVGAAGSGYQQHDEDQGTKVRKAGRS